MQIDTRKLKKLIIKAVPYVAFSYVGNLIGFAYRTAEGDGFQEKILPFMSNLGAAFARIFPSLHPFDLLFGLGLAGVMRLVLYVKSKNKKKFRQGEEYGSAVWGGEKDIEPYMDLSCPENNVILTKTESLTMGKPSAPKFARNKNILVIGGSGSGKTRFFVKPNLMQMHSSYVVTDPKGTVLVECGKMLERGRPKRVDGKVVYRRDDKGNYLKDKKGRYIPVYEPYKIKVFNTIDFAKSMHYNPFAYISKKNREKDILKFVEVLIKNTSSSQQPSGDDFWVKAEKLLYTAYIALIFAMYPEDQWNFETLIDMINNSECREDDEEFKNCIDLEFEIVEYWLNGTKHEDPEVMADYGDIFETKPDADQRRLGAFALKQFKAYKLAAGKTAKSILISCSTRLAPFAIDEVLEITSYDELHLDKLGDELSALFIIISDTDATFNFLVAIMYSQLFNLLCTKADNSTGGSLPYKYITSVKNGKQYVVFDFKDKAGKRKRKWVSTGLPEKCTKKALNEAVEEIVADFVEKWNSNQVVLNVSRKNDSDTESNENIIVNKELNSFFSDWLTAIKANSARTTFQCYKRNAERFVKYMGVHYPDVTLADLNHTHIQAYLNHKMDEGVKGSTVKQYYLALHSAFAYAVKMEMLTQHPMDKMSVPRAERHEAVFYNVDELNELFEVFKDHKLELIVHIAAYYGLRRCEILGLKWDSIDFKKGTITIERKVVSDYDESGQPKLFVETRLKTNSTRRTLPLIPHIRDMLLEKKDMDKRYKKLCGKDYITEFEGFVCCDPYGKLISPNTVTHDFHQVIKKNGLKMLRFHDLRHSCASLLLANDIPMKAIQEWLGHATFNITANLYSHLDYHAKVTSAETIARVLSGKNEDAPTDTKETESEEAPKKSNNKKRRKTHLRTSHRPQPCNYIIYCDKTEDEIERIKKERFW